MVYFYAVIVFLSSLIFSFNFMSLSVLAHCLFAASSKPVLLQLQGLINVLMQKIELHQTPQWDAEKFQQTSMKPARS